MFQHWLWDSWRGGTSANTITNQVRKVPCARCQADPKISKLHLVISNLMLPGKRVPLLRITFFYSLYAFRSARFANYSKTHFFFVFFRKADVSSFSSSKRKRVFLAENFSLCRVRIAKRIRNYWISVSSEVQSVFSSHTFFFSSSEKKMLFLVENFPLRWVRIAKRNRDYFRLPLKHSWYFINTHVYNFWIIF